VSFFIDEQPPLKLRASVYLMPLRSFTLGLQLELPTLSSGWHFGLSLYVGPVHLEVRRARWIC